MSKPEYDEVLHRLGKIVTKVDRLEEQARNQISNTLWRQLHFLRMDIHKLQNDMRADAPSEVSDDPTGGEGAPSE